MFGSVASFCGDSLGSSRSHHKIDVFFSVSMSNKVEAGVDLWSVLKIPSLFCEAELRPK